MPRLPLLSSLPAPSLRLRGLLRSLRLPPLPPLSRSWPGRPAGLGARPSPRTGWRPLAALLLAMTVVAGPGTSHAAREDVVAIQDLLARGQPQAALERLQARPGPPARAQGAPGEEAELRFLHGVALMDLQRNAEALGWFERMAQDHPELPDPHNNIALLHVRAGRLEPARQALETALRNDPSFRTARANLGLVHLMLAVQAFEHVAASGPVDRLLTRRLEGARALLQTVPAP